MEKLNVNHFWESKGSNFCIYFQILFQAELVALKRIRKNNIELKREVFVEMKQVCILRLLPSFRAFRWLEDERVALQRAIQFHSKLASCSSALIFIITFSSDFLQVRDLMHENINQYIGMCVESPNVCIVSMFCSRGSLQVTDIKFKLSYVLFLYSDATFVNPTIIG